MESPEVATLLDCLLDATSTKDNMSMRDFAASCFGEFVKYTIKQIGTSQLQRNYINIKSVVGRIESASSNPDLQKRYGAIMIMKAVLPFIGA